MSLTPTQFDAVFLHLVRKRAMLTEERAEMLARLARERRKATPNATVADLARELDMLTEGDLATIAGAARPVSLACTNPDCHAFFRVFNHDPGATYTCKHCGHPLLPRAPGPRSGVLGDRPKTQLLEGDGTAMHEILVAEDDARASGRAPLLSEETQRMPGQAASQRLTVADPSAEAAPPDDDWADQTDTSMVWDESWLNGTTAAPASADAQDDSATDDDDDLDLDDILENATELDLVALTDVPPPRKPRRADSTIQPPLMVDEEAQAVQRSSMHMSELDLPQHDLAVPTPPPSPRDAAPAVTSRPTSHAAQTQKSPAKIKKTTGTTTRPTFTGGSHRYTFRGNLAEGGMGKILVQEDRDLHRLVAMKVALPHVSENPGFLARFVAEARITGQLEHPNIVPVHEIGVDEDNRVFFTMKRIDGVSLIEILEELETLCGDNPEKASLRLHDAVGVSAMPGTAARAKERTRPVVTRMAQQGRSLSWLLNVFMKVCDAVAFGHHRGVIHRDIKPENVMVGEFGEVLLMDWGLAKVIQSAGRKGTIRQASPAQRAAVEALKTQEGAVAGTPAYMAPEQAMGRNNELDERTDVYALGATLYEMLTLKRAFESDDPDEAIQQVISTPVVPPRQRAPHRHIPVELEAIVMRAMARNPEARYWSVPALVEDIQAYLNGQLVSEFTLHYSRPQRLGRWARRHWVSVTAGVLLMIVAASVSWVTARYIQTEELQNRQDRAAALRQDGIEAMRENRFEAARGFFSQAMVLDPDEDTQGRLETAQARAAAAEAHDRLARDADLTQAALNRAETDLANLPEDSSLDQLLAVTLTILSHCRHLIELGVDGTTTRGARNRGSRAALELGDAALLVSNYELAQWAYREAGRIGGADVAVNTLLQGVQEAQDAAREAAMAELQSIFVPLESDEEHTLQSDEAFNDALFRIAALDSAVAVPYLISMVDAPRAEMAMRLAVRGLGRHGEESVEAILLLFSLLQETGTPIDLRVDALIAISNIGLDHGALRTQLAARQESPTDVTQLLQQITAIRLVHALDDRFFTRTARAYAMVQPYAETLGVDPNAPLEVVRDTAAYNRRLSDAILLLEAREVTLALPVLQELQAVDPHGVLAPYFLGRAYLMARRWREAERTLFQAAQIDWEASIIHRARGHAQLALTEYGLAADSFGEALSSDPLDREAAIGLIKAHLGMGEFNEAMDGIANLRKTTPNAPILLALRGCVRDGLGQDPLPDWAAALREDPRLPEARVARARYFLDARHPDDAMEDLLTVLRDTPQHEDALLMQAEAYLMMDIPTSAERCWEEAELALGEQAWRMYVHRGLAVAELRDDWLAALDDLQLAVEQAPESGTAWYALAEAYHALERWEDFPAALAEAEEHLAAYPALDDAHDRLRQWRAEWTSHEGPPPDDEEDEEPPADSDKIPVPRTSHAPGR